MITNDNFFLAKKSQKFKCIHCDYECSRKNDFKKHLDTKKHKMITSYHTCEKVPEIPSTTKSQMSQPPSAPPSITAGFQCPCGKAYSQKSNLSRHRKRCDQTYQEHKEDIIKQLLLQNQQLIFDNQEFKNMLIEIVSKPTNVTNNTNSHNSFNLNVFLNEKCKNAMNIGDFINSFQIKSSDFEDMGKLGYIQGISNIFIKNLRDLDETIRPLHCCDIKRETLYIKDNDVWDKDVKKDKIRKAIADIAHKNVKYIPIWTEANPDALDGTTKKNDQYMRIANQVMSAITPDDDMGINKIIRNVVNEVCIEKAVGEFNQVKMC